MREAIHEERERCPSAVCTDASVARLAHKALPVAHRRFPLAKRLISLAESGPDKVPGSSLQTAPSSTATTSATTLTMPTSVLQVCINVGRCISLVIEAGASA